MRPGGRAQAAVLAGKHPDALHLVLQALCDPVRLASSCSCTRRARAAAPPWTGGRPKSTMSHHFRVLREAGLVRTRVHDATHMNTLCRDSLEAAFPRLLGASLAAATGEA